MVDFYAVLGVDATVDEAAVRVAYRKLARENHPDVNPIPGAAARMRDINAAYETLGDAEKRQAFDASRQALQSAMAQVPETATTAAADAKRSHIRPAS